MVGAVSGRWWDRWSFLRWLVVGSVVGSVVVGLMVVGGSVLVGSTVDDSSGICQGSTVALVVVGCCLVVVGEFGDRW